MKLAIRIAAAILSVPPDVLAPLVPMMAPPPRNEIEMQVRNSVDSALSGTCSSASRAKSPLFALSEEEAGFVDCQTGLPSSGGDLFHPDSGDSRPSTYGEVTSLGARQMFHHMGLAPSRWSTVRADKYASDANDSLEFFDLGSGGGRLVMQAYLEIPTLRRSVGVELSPSRHAVAKNARDELLRSGDATKIRNLARKALGLNKDVHELDVDGERHHIDLYEGDLFELDISTATHIYVSSLCFSEEMLEKVVEKIEREATSLRILASLRQLTLPEINGKEKSISRLGRNPWMEYLEMSWTKGSGDGCPVYFYTVNNN